MCAKKQCQLLPFALILSACAGETPWSAQPSPSAQDPALEPVGSSGTTTTGGASSTVGVSDESTDDEGSDFIVGHDVDPSEFCDLFAQDCPAGQKCTLWASDGGNAFDATRCVAIAPNAGAKGDPCWAANDTSAGWTGIDSCDLGTVCWDIDPDTGIGLCIAFCEGDENNPHCPDPDEACSVGKEVALCFPKCLPLEDECPAGCGCYPWNSVLSCFPDASGDMGAYGDPCEFVNVCDPGNICANGAAVPGCESIGCCTKFCDLTAPDCPDEHLGVRCVPWDEDETDPDYINLGWCLRED